MKRGLDQGIVSPRLPGLDVAAGGRRMMKTIAILVGSLTLAGCLAEAGSEPDQAQVEAELSTPVLGGDLPGFSASQAKAIATA